MCPLLFVHPQWPWIKAGKPILNTEYFTARWV